MSEASDRNDGSTAEERREQDRAPITLRVDYKRLNTFFADYTRNISNGGTFIKTLQPLDLGTEFAFVLAVARAEEGAEPGPASDSSVCIELKGVVRWIVTEAQATAENPAGMGIQFVFTDDSERTHVEHVVAKLMRESLGDALADRLLATKRGPSGS